MGLDTLFHKNILYFKTEGAINNCKKITSYLEHHSLSSWDGMEQVTGDIVNCITWQGFLDDLWKVQDVDLDMWEGLDDCPGRRSIATTAVGERVQSLEEVMAFPQYRANPH